MTPFFWKKSQPQTFPESMENFRQPHPIPIQSSSNPSQSSLNPHSLSQTYSSIPKTSSPSLAQPPQSPSTPPSLLQTCSSNPQKPQLFSSKCPTFSPKPLLVSQRNSHNLPQTSFNFPKNSPSVTQSPS